MQLKTLKLQNIRSYTTAELHFPEGTLLLSGDIGSGKSSLLLAIEFALFGLQKGSLSGAALLRNGVREGKVELTFSLGGNEITICRSLKRGANAISQEAGSISINGARDIGTAVELKAKILELLGYPQEFLTKKNLLYRYTVYTPQEEMKQILFDHPDERLNILRKVFDIDKYKRVKENASIYLRELRERKRNFEGMISDLSEKKVSLLGKKEQQELVNKEVAVLLPKLEEKKQALQAQQKKVQEYEEKTKGLQEIKHQLHVLETELGSLVDHRKTQQQELDALQLEITELQQELQHMPSQKIDEGLAKAKQDLQKFQDFEKECSMKITECETKQRHEKELQKKILEIDNCPVCLQYVTSDHKERITHSSQEKISMLETHLKEHEDILKKNIKNLMKVQLKHDHLVEEQKQVAVYKIKLKNLADKEERAKQIVEFLEKSKKKIGEINMKKIDLQQQVVALAEVEMLFKKLRDELVTLQNEEKHLTVQYGSLKREQELMGLQLLELEKEIARKEQTKQTLERLHQLLQWLGDYFVQLMDVMEKHVFTSIYYQFNERFQHWFEMLLGDDTIQVRLDDTFTPIIEQNGYETSLENLSGGEKTSCALAYRLALNKAINDIIVTINTKELLILDEPTDGFSTEQLDRVRDVLDDLNLKQVILVSHENKIESFVDHVVRVEKEGHSSRIDN